MIYQNNFISIVTCFSYQSIQDGTVLEDFQQSFQHQKFRGAIAHLENLLYDQDINNTNVEIVPGDTNRIEPGNNISSQQESNIVHNLNNSILCSDNNSSLIDKFMIECDSIDIECYGTYISKITFI